MESDSSLPRVTGPMPASPARIPTIDDRLRGYGTRRGSSQTKTHMLGNQDRCTNREKGWRSPARPEKSNSSATTTALRLPKPHPPGHHGPSPRRVSAAARAATRVVRASTAMPASRSCRSRRRARDPVPRTCQQGRASQKVTSRIAQAEQAPQPNQAPAPPFAMPAAVKAARAGSGRAARLFGRYSALLASAHHDLRRDARVLERALSS